MSTKHTPGPWHIGMRPGPMVYGQKGEQVADMRPHWLVTDEHIANVKLIAAAPDLLAALEALVENYLDTYGDEGDDAPASIKAARAAIAKAGG